MTVTPPSLQSLAGAPTLDAFAADVTFANPYPAHAPSLAALDGEEALHSAIRGFPSVLMKRIPIISGPTFVDTSWTLPEAALFIKHLGRTRFHVSTDRQFARSYWTRICAKCRTEPANPAQKQPACTDDTCGIQRPRTVHYSRLGNYEYVRLSDPHFSAVLTADVDVPGSAGGKIENLNPTVLDLLTRMRALKAAPSWIGINPLSGKAQLIWMIDPVYSDGNPSKPNRPMKLLKRVQGGINELLGGDRAFAHGFMRNPFYSGPNPNAYRWNTYSVNLHKLKDMETMLQELGALTTSPDEAHTRPAKTGTDLINQAKANRERAQQMRALSNELDGLSIEELEQADPSYIDGVLVLYDAAGTPQRDETAFRHALKTGYRLHKRGERLKDAVIIDAYEHAYRIAHERDNQGRANELPPMRDRLTMARRVRAYVTTSKHTTNAGTGLSSTQHVTPIERNVLRTFGSRGGKKAAERWKDDTATEYQNNARKPLEAANKRRMAAGGTTKARVALFANQQFAETGQYPSVQELMKEVGVSRRTVQNALKSLGITLPVGRPQKGATP